MKACHACGQKLPLKVGDVVEGSTFGRLRQGVVWTVLSDHVLVRPIEGGTSFSLSRTGLTRLHGYYRITEREPLA